MKKFYYPTDSTLKRNILKFLEDDSEEQMLVVDLAFNEEDEDYYKYSDEFYITKPTTKNKYDFLDQFLTDMVEEEGIEEVPENVLLGFHAFNDMDCLKLEDLEDVRGKTLNHKIANYVINYVKNSASYYTHLISD